MADFHDHGAKFTVLELEFFAEDEIVTIVPNFSLPHNATMECLGGEFGPFRPNMPLEEVLDEERRLRNAFQELPFHYIEVAMLLLREAKDTFGEDLYRVQTLVEQIRKVRKTKIDAGLRMLDRPMTVKMNNLSSMECNMIRPFFLGSLDRKLDSRDLEMSHFQLVTNRRKPNSASSEPM